MCSHHDYYNTQQSIVRKGAQDTSIIVQFLALVKQAHHLKHYITHCKVKILHAHA